MAANNNEKEPQTVDLSKLIAEEKADRERQSDILKKRTNKDKNKKRLTIIGISTVAALLIGTVIIYDPFTQSLRWGEGPKQVDVGVQGDGGGTAIAAPDPYDWARKTGNLFPEPTLPWEEVPRSTSTDPASDDAAKNEKYWESGLRSAAQILPSEKTGFTSDDSKAVNSDGSLNPMYSYWTQESFYKDTIEILERLTNPIYGGWATYQYSDAIEGDTYSKLSTIFSDIIEPSALEGGTGIDRIPVLADWDGNDYGMGDQLLNRNQGNRWLGNITSIDSQFTFNEATEQYEVILVAKVTYSAWTQDRKVVTKDGTLTLNLASNVEKTVPSSNSKVVIRSAKLEF